MTFWNPLILFAKIIGDAFYGFFDEYPAKSVMSINPEDPTVGLVELTFDKKRVFKKTSVASFAYTMITHHDLEFRWTVKMTQLPDNTTLFQLQ